MNDLRCGAGRAPSWLGNPDRLEAFVSGARALSSSRDVPDGYSSRVLADQDNVRKLLSYAGALEARESSFAEQQMAVADLVLEWWLSHCRAEALALDMEAH